MKTSNKQATKEPKASVLIVDDTPENIQLLSIILGNQGYAVYKAECGQMALNSARANLPDLILLDIRMPDLSGFEVCVKLKADPITSEIPVIFISAADDAADKLEAFSAGGVDYISKPFQIVEVLARIETHLRLRLLQIELQEQTKLLENQNTSLQREICTLLNVDRSLHDALELAIKRQEFQLYYQPIVELETLKINGFEALLRWHHPDRGFISPLEFIPVAEATGSIAPIGEWVISQACRQMSSWQKQLPNTAHLTVSVNVSSKQLTHSGLVDRIQTILDETELNPTNLKLEITESAVMQEPVRAASMLCQLKKLGPQLCIDDFGTGYSSLGRLNDFPIDVLKIDRSFVRREDWRIVKAIIDLAHTLSMDVVAEGIETSAQLAELKKLDCKHGQGYFFAKPLAAAKVDEFLSDPMFHER